MTHVLSLLQARVYFTIRKFGVASPTRIGCHLQFDYEVAAPSVTRPLKGLIKMGLIRRIEINKRVVRYECAHETPPPFKIESSVGEALMMKELQDDYAAGQRSAPGSL